MLCYRQPGPGSLEKAGSAFDLPVASVSRRERHIKANLEPLRNAVFYGELGLDGGCARARALAVAGRVSQGGHRTLVVAAESGQDSAVVVEESRCIPSRPHRSRRARPGIVAGSAPPPVAVDTHSSWPASTATPRTLPMVKASQTAKRALEIAAAGNHNVS